jgi:hypothetical protein
VPVLKFSGKINLQEKKTQKLRPAHMIISSFDPAIQTTILYFSDPNQTYDKIGHQLGISKQAVSKRVALGKTFLASYGKPVQFPEAERLRLAETEVARLKELVITLQRELVLYNVLMFLADAFQEKVRKYFPRFKLRRLNPHQKKRSWSPAQSSQN